MNAMAPTRPTELHQCRFRLPAAPIAAARARKEVSDAIDAWGVKIDRDAAALLTSELVTNAVMHDGGDDILLTISYCHCQFRVDIHDTSKSLPVPVPSVSLDAEAGRGLLLVDTIADQWGYYRTPTGKAVFFTLSFPPEVP